MFRCLLRRRNLPPRPQEHPEHYASIIVRSLAARTVGLDSTLPGLVQSAWLNASGSFELFAASLARLLLDLENQARQATLSAQVFRAQAEKLGDRIIALERERDARHTRLVDERISNLEAELSQCQNRLKTARQRVTELEAILAQERSDHARQLNRLQADIAHLNRLLVERQELIDRLTGEADTPLM
ncbi:MAG: hypothetical protein H5T62_09515 [Anaerolineae bacterium]|nr:hypothetical protein [Anaerolineae bacterium]